MVGACQNTIIVTRGPAPGVVCAGDPQAAVGAPGGSLEQSRSFEPALPGEALVVMVGWA